MKAQDLPERARHTAGSVQRAALSALFAATLATAASPGWADDHDDDDNAIPFAEAHIFFELNNTDGDLGIHALIDGEPWKELEIEGLSGRELLDIRVKSRLRQQGLTEIFFESAEPPFDELLPADFFSRFPAGEYTIEGETLDGLELESTTELTHVMPAPPVPTVNGLPMAVQCDDEEPGFDATVTSAPVTIAWDAVTMSHPDAEGGGAGVQPPVGVTIHNYQVVVEVEVGDFASVLSVILPPGVTSMTIPAEFIAQGEEFKYEVLAREESFNQTAVESCFVLE
jgi:hypothetical protein